MQSWKADLGILLISSMSTSCSAGTEGKIRPLIWPLRKGKNQQFAGAKSRESGRWETVCMNVSTIIANVGVAVWPGVLSCISQYLLSLQSSGLFLLIASHRPASTLTYTFEVAVIFGGKNSKWTMPWLSKKTSIMVLCAWCDCRAFLGHFSLACIHWQLLCLSSGSHTLNLDSSPVIRLHRNRGSCVSFRFC